MSDERPRLLQERVYAGEAPEDELPEFEHGRMKFRFPHCDSLILHAPDECKYCRDCTALQEERERLDISNTGQMNRKWMCPADVRRSPEQYDAWRGNKRNA